MSRGSNTRTAATRPGPTSVPGRLVSQCSMFMLLGKNPTYRFFFLWRFFLRRFFLLWVAILWRFLFLPQGIGSTSSTT